MPIDEGWMRSAAHFGLVHSYREQLDGTMLPDHGPVEISLYAVSEYAYRFFAPSGEVMQPLHRMFAKFPAILADLIVAFLLFLIFRSLRTPQAGLIASAVWLFHPAVIYESAWWGQTDSIFLLFLVAALWALVRKQYWLIGAFFALAVFSKPQALIFLPLFLIAGTRTLRAAIASVTGGLIVVLAVLLVFAAGGSLERLLHIYTNMPAARLSFNAFNLWWGIFGGNAWDRGGDDLFLNFTTFHTMGLLLFAMSYGSVLFFCRKSLRSGSRKAMEMFCLTVSVVSLSFFLFNAGVHERYMFPVIAFGLPLIFMTFRGRLLYACITGIFFINIWSAFEAWSGIKSHDVLGIACSVILLLCLCQFFFLILLPKK